MKKYFHHIQFWILIFFLIRLFHITNAPLEVAHNWRQTTVTMVTRNFLETDNNIFYPRVDFAGEKTGITGMEFPLLNYLSYLISYVFGYAHWYGRLINLFISSFGIFYFFKLIKKYFSEELAFKAAIILMCSIWFMYARKVMPDTFSMSLTIIGFYFGTNYFDHQKSFKNLLLYFLFCLTGILSKLPSGYILPLFSFFIFDKKVELKSKIIFSLASILFLIPVAFWYLFWVSHLVKQFQFWHFFMGENIAQGWADLKINWLLTCSNFYDNALKFIGFFVFVGGLIWMFIKREKKLQKIFFISSIFFFMIMLKAGYTFAFHAYYISPIVPIMALICAYFLQNILPKKIAWFLLIAICFENIANQQHDFFLKENCVQILNLEKDLDAISNQKDLIAINSGDCPTPMYFAHRKGWIASNETLANAVFVSEIKNKGLKYIVVLKRAFGSQILLPYKIVFDSNNYTIYQP